MVGNGIKQISIDTGTTTDQLLKGAFMIESASYRGQDALNVLKVAAQGARLENTDLGDTANTLTSLLHDYAMKTTQAGAAMSGLIQTEADGKMHMADLTKAMGNVLPLASSLGVSFPQIGAAIAVMTNSGMTAMRATQNLNFVLRDLAAPSSVASSMMQIVGLSADQVKKTLQGPGGLLGALTLIEDAVGKHFPKASADYTTALKDIMGGATGWNVALKLSGDHLKEMQTDISNISTAMGNSSTLTDKWAQMQQTFNFQLDQTKAALNVAAIDVGTVLIPVLERALAAVSPLIGQFTTWVQTSPGFQNAVNGVATAIGNAATWMGNLVQGAVELLGKPIGLTLERMSGRMRG
jgi:TP901 family phage tail tape measure protein